MCAFPQRANAGFLQVVSRSHVRLRVYERGAGETLACGTGACAAVAAGIRLGLLDIAACMCTRAAAASPLPGAARTADSLFMTGPATTVFEGQIDIPDHHDQHPRSPITEEDIANFLTNTPGFFERHAEVLASVQITSPHGQRAVSLQERQAEMLREKIKGLEQRVMDMVRNSHDNEAIATKVHQWTSACCA
jgi:hypothetical protein